MPLKRQARLLSHCLSFSRVFLTSLSFSLVFLTVSATASDSVLIRCNAFLSHCVRTFFLTEFALSFSLGSRFLSHYACQLSVWFLVLIILSHSLMIRLPLRRDARRRTLASFCEGWIISHKTNSNEHVQATNTSRQCLHGGYSVWFPSSQRKVHDFDFCC